MTFISILIISQISPYSVHKLQNIRTCMCRISNFADRKHFSLLLSLIKFVYIYLSHIHFQGYFFINFFFFSGKIHVNGCMTEVRSSLFKHVMPLLLICALVSLIVGLIELLLLLCAVCFADHIKVIFFDIWRTLKTDSHFQIPNT